MEKNPSSPAFFAYWGKAAKQTEETPAFHLLPYHALDVAACGVQLLEVHKSFRNTLCALTGWDEAELLEVLPLLLALHDLGKFSPAFQDLRYDIVERLQPRPRNPQEYWTRHDQLGYSLWLAVVVPYWQSKGVIEPSQASLMNALMQAMTGHHGKPLSADTQNIAAYFPEKDQQAALAFADDLLALFPQAMARLKHCNANRITFASWWLAGLAVLSDWLGSNRNWFAYEPRYQPLGTYWQHARQRAVEAIRDTELVPASVADEITLGQLIGTERAVQHTPLQQIATQVSIGQGPQLFILEDVTGAGKTEAALLLAHRLMAAGLAEGLYFGLPTMATANAMYERLGKVYRHFYRDEQAPSLVLSHGARQLSETFRQAVVPIRTAQEDEVDQQETPASNHCAEWLADNRKKALLAEVGIGSLDQALLAILPNKHQSLRMLGLSRKVLLVDEVHACDAYMNTLLKRLLTAHAKSGGSAILLSATLPQEQRDALQTAFSDGLSASEADQIMGFTFGPTRQPEEKISGTKVPYPLLTHFDGDECHLYPLATRESVKRSVDSEFLHTHEAIAQKIAGWVEQGDCVCWIANTVGDARRYWQRLKAAYPQWSIMLFHARYALADRLAIESDVVSRFGKKSEHKGRKGQLLIATQVVEQSLDIDFDHLVSDLAPIDLLIQRAGRLHRHLRDALGNPLSKIHGQADRRPSPCLTIHAPQWCDTPKEDWYSRAFRDAAYVYPNHAQLWLGMRLLREKGGFRMPEDARDLIEGVYGEALDVPEQLQECALDADGERRSEASIANLNALNLELGYNREQGIDWWDDANTPTRLSEETQTIWLATWNGEQVNPLNPGDFCWQRSSLNLSKKKVKAANSPAGIPQAQIDAVMQKLPAQGKWGVLLILLPSGDAEWQGEVIDGQDQVATVRYSRRLGWQAAEESRH